VVSRFSARPAPPRVTTLGSRTHIQIFACAERPCSRDGRSASAVRALVVYYPLCVAREQARTPCAGEEISTGAPSRAAVTLRRDPPRAAPAGLYLVVVPAVGGEAQGVSSRDPRRVGISLARRDTDDDALGVGWISNGIAKPLADASHDAGAPGRCAIAEVRARIAVSTASIALVAEAFAG